MNALQVAVMVLLAWAIPTAIFFPTIMGWETLSGQPIDRSGPTIYCTVAFANDRLFNFVLTVGYYWTTLVALIALYVGIYRVALKLHRKSEEKQKRVTNTIFSMAGNNLSKFSVGLTEQATVTGTTSTSAARAQDMRSLFTYTTDAPEDSYTERSSSEAPRHASCTAASRNDGYHLEVRSGLTVPSPTAEKSFSSTATASESIELRPARSPIAAPAEPPPIEEILHHSQLQHAATMRSTISDCRPPRKVRIARHHSFNDAHTTLEAIALSPPPVPPQVSLLMQLTRSPDSVPLIRYIDNSSPPSSRESASGCETRATATLAEMQTKLMSVDEKDTQGAAILWQRRISSVKRGDMELDGGHGAGADMLRCPNGDDAISRTLSIHSPRRYYTLFMHFSKNLKTMMMTRCAIDVYLISFPFVESSARASKRAQVFLVKAVA